MEFVPFTTQQLLYLAKQDTCLAPIFEGVFAADQLLGEPDKYNPRAYTVNTDEKDKPGSHWLAILTMGCKCEVFDSYGLPLNWYRPFEAIEWIYEHFETISSNAVSLQEIDGQSCRQYALIYFKYKPKGKSLRDFVSLFKKGDYVHNDHLLGKTVKPLLDWQVKNCKSCSRTNHGICKLYI